MEGGRKSDIEFLQERSSNMVLDDVIARLQPRDHQYIRG